MEAIKSQLAQFRTKLDEIPALQTAEATVRIPKEYLVIAGGVLTLAILFSGVGASTLCNVVGFLYPSYKSFEAIERRVRKDRQWLAYWVLFAFFFVIEIFADILLYLFPFYYAVKLGFLLWAMLPQSKGAQYLYETFMTEQFREVLLFSISRVNHLLREASPVPPGSGEGAPVYLAAVLQFLTQRILKLAAGNAGQEREIGTQDVSNGIASDEDISRVLGCPVDGDTSSGDFTPDIVKVLEAVDADKTLSADALQAVNTHLNKVFTRIVFEAGKMCTYSNNGTMSSREIQSGIRLLFPSDLAKSAVDAGTEAVTAYSA